MGAELRQLLEVLEVALERLRRARARVADAVARGGLDGLGEILGDLNFSIARLEQALKLLKGRGP